MHALHYLPHRHARSGIIGHRGTALSAAHTLTRAVAQSATWACTQLPVVTVGATQAIPTTPACMQVQKLPHKHACTALPATLARIPRHTMPHMRLHNLPYSDALVASTSQARIWLHNLPHMYARRCIICHASMRALHYLPHRHACSRIIRHAGGHAGAEPAMPSTTQA